MVLRAGERVDGLFREVIQPVKVQAEMPKKTVGLRIKDAQVIDFAWVSNSAKLS